MSRRLPETRVHRRSKTRRYKMTDIFAQSPAGWRPSTVQLVSSGQAMSLIAREGARANLYFNLWINPAEKGVKDSMHRGGISATNHGKPKSSILNKERGVPSACDFSSVYNFVLGILDFPHKSPFT
jgi:hypothetical protein